MGGAHIPFEVRVVSHLSGRFLLDISEYGRMGSPTLDALLCAAVLEANVSRLNRDPELQAAYARVDRPPPDEVRRPVSINAVATSLRLPFETVRRHINELVRRGRLASGAGGVYVPAEVVGSAPFIAALRARYDRVFRFYDELLAVGAVEPLPFTPPPLADPAAPVRAVGRILSDYYFRALDALHRQAPDMVTVLVLLEAGRANTEHLSLSETVMAMRAGTYLDVVRTPVSVAQLSRRLNVPYETTRRHVTWLVEQGFARRVDGGILLAAEYFERPDVLAAAADNLANVRRMFRLIAALPLQASPAQRRTREFSTT